MSFRVITNSPSNPHETPTIVAGSVGLNPGIALALFGGKTPILFSMADIHAGRIRDFAITILTCPLFHNDFGPEGDVTGLLSLLNAQGYRGRVIAVAPPLPNVKMVEREIRTHAAEGIEFKIIAL